MKTQSGIITSIVRSKGFGFIKTQEINQLFFHLSEVIEPRFMDLKEGMKVDFLVTDTPKGKQAIGIVSARENYITIWKNSSVLK